MFGAAPRARGGAWARRLAGRLRWPRRGAINGRAASRQVVPLNGRRAPAAARGRQSRAPDRRLRFRYRRPDRAQGAGRRCCRHEDFIYLGDTARLPYGTKSNEVIVRYSRENTEFLLAKGIKLLVVACNTSSAVALDEIARDTMVPVIGVIEPGARAAARGLAHRQNRRDRHRGDDRLGRLYARDSAAAARAPRFTRAPARCWCRWSKRDGPTTKSPSARSRYYLESLKQSGIDTLLLGCTHYPLLRAMFARVLGAGVKIVDSATATAAAVRERLAFA